MAQSVNILQIHEKPQCVPDPGYAWLRHLKWIEKIILSLLLKISAEI